MKLMINIVLTLLVLAAGIYGGRLLLEGEVAAGMSADSHGHTMDMDEEASVGPHGGRLLQSENLALEITVYERGVPPEFRVFAYHNNKPVPPEEIELNITLSRLGGDMNHFVFNPREDYLFSKETVIEPHSFDVAVVASYAGRTYEWQYEQHEGRTQIPVAIANTAGIETALVGSAMIEQNLSLQGQVRYDTGRVRQVRARYPGMILKANYAVGSRVGKGQVLASIESDDSLQSYDVKAPISGVIIEQRAGSGDSINAEPIYVIANLQRLWIDLAVFRQQLSELKQGQAVHIRSLDGEQTVNAKIDYLLPVSDTHSQTTIARVYLDNPKGEWQPGMAVTATVMIKQTEVPLAVRNSALQTFRDFDVVYAKFGDTYEVRMLELGQRDEMHTEVLSGLKPGTEYVVSNSYLLKADIEKSGAEHSH